MYKHNFSTPAHFGSERVIIDDPVYSHGRIIVNLENGIRNENWNSLRTWLWYVDDQIKEIGEHLRELPLIRHVLKYLGIEAKSYRIKRVRFAMSERVFHVRVKTIDSEMFYI